MRRSALILTVFHQLCHGQTFTIEGNAPAGPEQSIPFGRSSGVNYHGFIYKNIPPFILLPGDQISFDLAAPNDADIICDISLATAAFNGSDEVNSDGFTKVVSSGTPAAPRGNSISGDYELAFTSTSHFAFGGGGLIIRFQSQGSFVSDTTSTPVMRYSNSNDSSGFFVQRFHRDPDGEKPYSFADGSYIANFRLSGSGSKPILNDQSFRLETDINKSLEMTLQAEENTAPVTYEIVKQPLNGTIDSFDQETGQLTYTPNESFQGVDTIEAKAVNLIGESDIAAIRLEISESLKIVDFKLERPFVSFSITTFPNRNYEIVSSKNLLAPVAIHHQFSTTGFTADQMIDLATLANDPMRFFWVREIPAP